MYCVVSSLLFIAVFYYHFTITIVGTVSTLQSDAVRNEQLEYVTIKYIICYRLELCMN